MINLGCKTFADLLTAGSGDIMKAFQDNVAGGLTIFCPIDQAMEAFMPKFKKLKTAEEKTSVLMYHAMPVYESLDMLKSDNGVVNTLATDGRSKDYNLTVKNDGEVVTLRTGVTTAKITGTLVDEDLLAVYTIDQVLEPRELFKPEKPQAPAPSPVAEAPKGSKKKGKEHVHSLPPAPAGPEEEPADEDTADDANAGWRSVSAELMKMMVVAVVITMSLVF